MVTKHTIERKIEEDLELLALRKLFAEMLKLAVEDIRSPWPECITSGETEAYRAKVSAINFVKSSYCQLICDFLGIDYNSYKQYALKKLVPLRIPKDKKQLQRENVNDIIKLELSPAK